MDNTLMFTVYGIIVADSNLINLTVCCRSYTGNHNYYYISQMNIKKI